MFACCAGEFVYLDAILSRALIRYPHINSFVFSMYRANGISKDIYNTMIKAKNVAKYYKVRILLRLLMDFIRDKNRYRKFKKGVTDSLKAIYDQLELVG